MFEFKNRTKVKEKLDGLRSFRKASLQINTLGVRALTYEFWEDTNIQSITTLLIKNSGYKTML